MKYLVRSDKVVKSFETLPNDLVNKLFLRYPSGLFSRYCRSAKANLVCNEIIQHVHDHFGIGLIGFGKAD